MTSASQRVVTLDLRTPVWERIFTVSPLVLIGSKEETGGYDFAPKHMAFQLGWGNYFGFVCDPRHSTYRNIQREEVFTVSYPQPTQIVLAGLAAAPRQEDDTKPSLGALSTFRAREIDGVFVQDAYLFLECRLDRVIDGFEENSLITGRVVAAQAAEDVLLDEDRDHSDILHQNPLLAYLYPSRYALLKKGSAFPFPVDFKK
jgi:flavin reductase (DIM6/NTAB) family NADH-FMN oxidoreductase RutF